MIRILLIVFVIVGILGGLGYWRFILSKPALISSETSQSETGPIEVPKTLPQAGLEDRVKTLEDTVTKLVAQVNALKSPQPQAGIPASPQINNLDAEVTALKARVSALEKASPAAAAVSNSKYPLYIPLGAGGGSWTNTDWNTLNEYQVSIDPDNYTGYTGMVLEVNFRLVDPTGTGSVRLYNTTDSKAISSEISTSATSFAVYSTFPFQLSSGAKTYKLQVKSPQGKDLFIQSARIKVNF